MQMLLNVTAVIPTYNRCMYLEEALQSVLCQTKPPFQVIVVDDGSDDDTRAVLTPFMNSIEYIYKENGGKSAALNLALSRVRGDAVWIFDDDDVAEPHAIETLSRELTQDPSVGFACAKHSEFSLDQDGNRTCTIRDALLTDAIHKVALHRCAMFQGGMLVRTECYTAIGPFDETLVRAQDYDMLLRLARTFRGVEVNAVLFHQRMHSGPRGSASTPIRRHDQFRAQRRYEQMIFRKVHAEYALQEFGRSSHPARKTERVDLLIERATVMGRKGLWELAEQDVREALQAATLSGMAAWSASSQDCLAAVFDKTSVGLSEFVNAANFHRLLRETSAFPLTRTMCRIFSASLRVRVREAILSKKTYIAMSLMAALACIVFSRFSFVAALCRLLLDISDRRRVTPSTLRPASTAATGSARLS